MSKDTSLAGPAESPQNIPIICWCMRPNTRRHQNAPMVSRWLGFIHSTNFITDQHQDHPGLQLASTWLMARWQSHHGWCMDTQPLKNCTKWHKKCKTAPMYHHPTRNSRTNRPATDPMLLQSTQAMPKSIWISSLLANTTQPRKTSLACLATHTESMVSKNKSLDLCQLLGPWKQEHINTDWQWHWKACPTTLQLYTWNGSQWSS